MSTKKKQKKKKINKKHKKKKTTKKKSSSKKVVLKSEQKKPTKAKTKSKSKKKQIEEKPKPKPNVPVLFFIVFIIGILIYGAVSIYKIQQEEYNRLTTYTIQTNLSNFKVCFENKKGNKTSWQKIISNTPIETYARNKKINIKNTENNDVYSFNSDEQFFKYYGDDSIFLTSNGEYALNYIYYNGKNKELSFISDNDTINIKDNKITCNKSGNTVVYVTYDDQKIKLLDVKTSSLIVDRPKEFDVTKEFLSCEQYTKEENDELDKILEDKINSVGYLTRAGAVEALRFLTLDMPYRIQYFNENGRYPYVDGEGRYYHKGLYLSSDRYSGLIDPEKHNKGTWGCRIYSNPLGGKEANGLDCSGLICWALFNAGYDPDDKRGADLLMNLGDIAKPKEAIKNNQVKVGDLVHNNEAESHIGMIVGIDDENNFYVAQAIWYKPNGVCITKYSEKKMASHWLQIILMDKYYQKDGNLTNMWY